MCDMAFDYKKEYKEFYLPKDNPSIIDISSMNFLAVRGEGNPNDIDGEYKRAIEKLYTIAFTLKMSYKGHYKIADYFEYVVPPLEGFWWQDGIKGVDYSRKDLFQWISMIRLPDFITKEDFDWAIHEATKKKQKDFSDVKYFTYREGLCVQCMHIGPYDDEPATLERMTQYINESGYEFDFNENRYHHEIYLSDPRKCNPTNMKTVIRHPIKKKK